MLAQKQKQLSIGQVAKQSGISIGTIRYYEALGLLKSSGRTEGGFRQFSPPVFNRLAFIKRAQNLGLSLEEIREILQVYDRGKPPCGEIKEKLANKLLEIDCQIQELLTLQAELKKLLSGWQSLPELQNEIICPIIQADKI